MSKDYKTEKIDYIVKKVAVDKLLVEMTDLANTLTFIAYNFSFLFNGDELATQKFILAALNEGEQTVLDEEKNLRCTADYILSKIDTNVKESILTSLIEKWSENANAVDINNLMKKEG